MNKPLSASARNVTSYDGEDGLIEELFKRIGTKNTWCMEFGARDGKLGSNTWNLINNLGWHAILIDGNHWEATQLKKLYAGNPKVIAREQYVAIDGPQSLDAILSETKAPHDIDLLIIDIDSYDYHIWKSLKNFRPRVVMIEYYENIPASLSWIQPLQGPHTGSSLKAITELGASLGYTLVYAKNNNAIFVDTPIAQQHSLSLHPEDYSEKSDIAATGQFIQATNGTFILFNTQSPQEIQKTARIQKYIGSQIYIATDKGVSPIKPHREYSLIRKTKDIIKNSFIGNILYPIALKYYKKLSK